MEFFAVVFLLNYVATSITLGVYSSVQTAAVDADNVICALYVTKLLPPVRTLTFLPFHLLQY